MKSKALQQQHQHGMVATVYIYIHIYIWVCTNKQNKKDDCAGNLKRWVIIINNDNKCFSNGTACKSHAPQYHMAAATTSVVEKKENEDKGR